MLYLIVKPAIEHVNQPAAADIASGQHLLFKKSRNRAMLNNRHAFMIRRKNKTKINSEQPPVHQRKDKRLPYWKKRNQQYEIKAKMYGDK